MGLPPDHRGNNRQRIFQSHDDHLKFLRLLERQKAKLPFYVYAYCLMPNHVHLLAEMRDDPISRVMHGLLTAYSQYHNRKYRQMGHLFQGRYKAILCQSDRYLAALVRYIHLNPVRAKVVARPEETKGVRLEMLTFERRDIGATFPRRHD